MEEETIVLFIWDVPQRLREYLDTYLGPIDSIKLIYQDNPDYQDLAKKAHITIGWRPEKIYLTQSSDHILHINPGVGVQHLIPLFREVNEERDNPLRLSNGHGNTYFTAQHSVALLHALTNKIIPHHNWMVDGLWRRGDNYAKSDPLRDKTIGLLGYGAINQKVHRFLSGYDLSFAALKTNWQDGIYDEKLKKYTPDELQAFLSEIDVVIVAVPSTHKTKGLLGEEEFQLLEGKYLVTVARGDVIDQKALFQALETKKLVAAAIDVWYNYQPDEDAEGKKYPYDPAFPFHTLDNVILSPHRGASPMDDLNRWYEVVTNIRLVHERDLDSIINRVGLDREY